MKKLYTLLAVAFFGFIGNAQIVNIPDANFKTLLLAANTTSGCAFGPGQIHITIDTNSDGEIQLSEAGLVYELGLNNGNISDLTGINSFVNLTKLGLQNNLITHLNLDSLTSLESIQGIDNNNNPLVSINLNSLDSLGALNSYFNSALTTIHISNCVQLGDIEVMTCNLNSLVITNCPNLNTLDCEVNHLTSLNLANFSNLIYLDCDLNQLTDLNISGTTNLYKLSCTHNQIPLLDLSMCYTLSEIYCNNNLLTSLDTSQMSNLMKINCSNNDLHLLSLKNGFGGILGETGFANNPNLTYVCADDFELTVIQNLVNNYGYTNCVVNSYCSFGPGGYNFFIQGNNTIDISNSGCSNSNPTYPNLKFALANSSFSGTQICDASGSYTIPVTYGTHTITPVLENPNYFNVLPSSITRTFPTDTSPSIQDFCIVANGSHNDLEIVILPTNSARPGFDAAYKIIYKNKGTTTQSGTVSLSFYDPIEDFVSANPSFTSQSTNTLNWNFSNLLPFETRQITVIFNINSPTETPAVNAGNIIGYAATVTGAADETPNDNISNLSQTVVNSLDPNDKTCTEGNYLLVNEVGKYLHYIIRFENSGTANAQNIVVKDIIDTTKFDISSLVPLTGSHSFETKISSGNKVEFIFQNINLPFDDANNDSYVAFKIKTLSTLTDGQTINNSASIYFDYNAPIVTNTNTVNVYNPLSSSDFDFGNVFSLSPVPTKNSLTITTKQSVIISSVNIYNTLGQLVQVVTEPSQTIDVADLKTGTYFIKIISDKGTASSKFIKE